MRVIGKNFLLLLLLGCNHEAQIEGVADDENLARRAACLPAVSNVSIVDECGNDPRNYPVLIELYNGSASMPAAHRRCGEAFAAQIIPRNGKIVVVAEGMSNALRVFDALAGLLASSGAVNPAIRFVNNAQGGIDLQEWVERVGIGAIDNTVQVALLYHCLSNNFSGCDLDSYADITKEYLKRRILQLKIKYPNLKQVFIQSREFGGWKCYSAPGALAEPAAHHIYRVGI